MMIYDNLTIIYSQYYHETNQVHFWFVSALQIIRNDTRSDYKNIRTN